MSPSPCLSWVPLSLASISSVCLSGEHTAFSSGSGINSASLFSQWLQFLSAVITHPNLASLQNLPNVTVKSRS